MLETPMFLSENKQGGLSILDESEADYVMITKSEFYGYEKALRIVRDRALQEIEKSEADEHGYRFLRADKRSFNYAQKELKAWLITKSTPYSIKMSPDDALAIIENDLHDFYNFRDLPTYEEGLTPMKLSSEELLRLRKMYFEEGYDPEGQLPETEYFINFIFENNGTVIFDISKLSGNLSSGCYEVTYWATDII